MGEKYNLKNLLLKGQKIYWIEESYNLQPQETITGRVKSRRQAYDKDLFDTSLSYTAILMNLLIFEECYQ